MRQFVSRRPLLFSFVLLSVYLVLIGGASTDENVPANVVQNRKGKLTQIHIQNQGLSFILSGEHHFYTDDDSLLQNALIAAFANDLEVTVGASELGVKESEDKTLRMRKATSVIMWRD
jgi:hypothetical protein